MKRANLVQCGPAGGHSLGPQQSQEEVALYLHSFKFDRPAGREGRGAGGRGSLARR